MTAMSTDELVATWRHVLAGFEFPWVVFAHSTCVALTVPEEDLARQATELLREFGPVHPGSPSGDILCSGLKNAEGWIVGGDRSDIVTYVAPGEVHEGAETVAIGIFGRSKRHLDGTELRIVPIEDKRGPQPA